MLHVADAIPVVLHRILQGIQIVLKIFILVFHIEGTRFLDARNIG